MNDWAMIAVAVIGIAAMIGSLAVLDSRMLPAASLRRSLGLSFAVASTGAATWLLLEPLVLREATGDLYFPIAALAGLAALLATISVRAGGAGPTAVLIFAVAWTALVVVPAAFLAFIGLPDFRPTDHGGSIVVNVAAGAAALGVLVTMGKDAPRLRPPVLSLRAGVAAVVVLCLGWVAWLVGAELAIDSVTPSIVLNTLLGAFGGAIGWLVVQRVRHRRTTISAVAAGVVAGLVSITAGASFYTPLFAGVAGLVAGALASLFTLRRVEVSRRQQWYVVGSHLVAGGIGVVLLGVLATDTGYIYTGDTGITFTGIFSFFERQVISTVVVAAYSALVSGLLWAIIRGVGAARRG